MGNQTAGAGEVFVCSACGKRSRDRYGFQAIDPGWDVSCALNAVLCDESSLVMENGRIIKAQAKKKNTEE